MKRKYFDDKPLYITLPYFPGEYTVTFEHDHRLSGYGLPDFTKYPPDLPVIDYTNDEKVFESLKIPDSLRPAEESYFYSGSMKTFFDRLQIIGITVKTTKDYQTQTA